MNSGGKVFFYGRRGEMSINERKGGIYLSIPKLSICVSNKNFDMFEELFVSIYVFRDI